MLGNNLSLLKVIIHGTKYYLNTKTNNLISNNGFIIGKKDGM